MKDGRKSPDGLIHRDGKLICALPARSGRGLLLLPLGCSLGSERGAFVALLLANLLSSPRLMVIATLRHKLPR